jgi:hypothetical protein
MVSRRRQPATVSDDAAARAIVLDAREAPQRETAREKKEAEVSEPIAADRRRTGPPTITSRLWYRAVFGDAPVDACQIPIIREHFAEALGVAGWPDGACLFLSTRHVRGKAVPEDVSAVGEAIYFSPAAIAEVPHLIAVCGAEPSPPPDRGCATLLVGKESDWDLLPRGSH